MRELFFGNKAYEFPTRWEELSREQFLALMESLIEFIDGKTNAAGCRAMWFCRIAGIDIRKRDNDNALFWENIYRASDIFRFFFEIQYIDPETRKPKDLHHLPKEIRDKLRRFTPDELPDYPEFRWAAKLKHRHVIDAVFSKNLLSELNINGKFYPGYRFGMDGNILTTSLTAGQFIDALTVYNEYVTHQGTEHLNLLIAVLYFRNQPEVVKKVVNTMPERVKMGILLNFQAIMAFLMNKTRYAIIWNRDGKDATHGVSAKIDVGFADSIYSLAKNGFGTVAAIEKMNLVTYLDLLLKNIVDSVKILHENEINVAEIAERTNLSIAQVQRII